MNNMTNTFTTTAEEMLDSLFTKGTDLMGFDTFTTPFGGSAVKYPPHDVIARGNDEYEIRFALAGFDKKDIGVTVDDNILTISASVEEKRKEKNEKYFYKGIGKRAFKNSFRIPTYAEVEECTLTNGILSIIIKKMVPEEKLPKKVEIN